eukprot:1159183-Pelagomonas_calceolata.AAC.1
MQAQISATAVKTTSIDVWRCVCVYVCVHALVGADKEPDKKEGGKMVLDLHCTSRKSRSQWRSNRWKCRAPYTSQQRCDGLGVQQHPARCANTCVNGWCIETNIGDACK